MRIEFTKKYEKSQKKLIEQGNVTLADIKETFEDLKKDPQSVNLKKIKCKHQKNRYSIRLKNTQYRILIDYENDLAILQCICDHDDYDRRNKDC